MFRFPVDDEIELRLHEEWHAEELYELIDCNRDHLGPWFPWVEETRDATDSLEFIRSARQRWADYEALELSIWVDDRIVGTCGFSGLNWRVDNGELGYWLGEDYQGRGIVTRSCRALIDYGFEVLELHRISLRCAPDNTRSAAVARRLGFTHEGRAREVEKIDGEWMDFELFSLLVDEWDPRG